jgi:MFS transporter, FHS family, glucose/mannose:H+ symporter
VPTATRKPDRKHRPGAAALLHASFVLSGILTTLLGSILPLLAARWSLNHTQAGDFFAAQFTGALLGVGASSGLAARWGLRRSLILAFLLMACGVGSLEWLSWHAALASVFLYGGGLGLSIPSTNLLVSDLYPGRRAAALSLLNLAWGAGAVASPALTELALRARHPSLLFWGLAGAAAVIAVSLALNRGIPSAGVARPAAPLTPPRPAASLWRNPSALLLAAMFFLYVGTENAVSGWVGTYTKALRPGAGTAWLLAPECFWAALLVGRGVAPVILRRLAETRLRGCGLVVAASGVAVILAARTPAGAILGVVLAGLGLAPVFPITIAALSHGFGERASRLAGAMFAMAALGGAILPWLVGYSSTRFGTLKAGLAIPLAGVGLMIATHLKSSSFLYSGALENK